MLGGWVPILDWMTRGDDVRAAARVPYRLLEAVPDLDGGNGDTANMLIQGDNLDALKALLPYYKGAVKCIYIDPPYNTRSAFEHYDDNLEHSQWLAMIYPRLVLLRDLLSEDGSIWLTIGDDEGHYLKVICDEIFGRKNFIASFVWEKDKGRRNDAVISSSHDTTLLYTANAKVWSKTRNLLPRSEDQDRRYKNPDEDHRGPWLQGDNGTAKSGSESLRYPITSPSGKVLLPPKGNFWRFSKETLALALQEGRVYFGKSGGSMPVIKRYLTDVQQGIVPRTWWPAEEAGTNQSAKRDHLRKLLPEIEPFATPKPEQLLSRILHIASNPGDLVIDSFLGSGTTAAVAHKMGRRWIGIEMGDHAETHCKPRLDKVIAGEQGGVSEAVGWTGGGGYRFYRLGAAVFDADGHIADGIAFATLAAHVWFSETGMPFTGTADTPVLGMHDGTAYALLYNGILGDRSVSGGNVLTAALLERLREASGWDGPMTVYGEWSKLGTARLADAGVTFKQTPYDVKAR